MILTLLVGCKNDNEELVFEDFFIEEVSENDCNPEVENCAFISIQTPMALKEGERSKKINRRIEEHIRETVDYQEMRKIRSLEALAQRFIDDYEASVEEFPDYNIPWEASVDGKIIYRNLELISMEFRTGIFTGGAHGYTSVTFLNLNPKTGELYSENDLFEADFKAYAEELFRKKNEIAQNAPINSTGMFFENDEFHLPKNIGFRKDKLILRYNPYEVASYAEGGIQLEVPLEEARKFLKIF
jgi:hypothetical protein